MTVGQRASDVAREWFADNRYQDYLYLHGLGFGEWMWHFTANPAYDYAALQAKAGHVSVTIDRLGYDASGRPAGKQSCLAGQASIALNSENNTVGQ